MMSRELPIFPLPLVLFPGATQPLHIFEPRYRRLLADCLESDKRFGIAYVPPPATDASESSGPPPPPPVLALAIAPAPGAVGCVARIHSAQSLPDGRSNILTVGERRFVLLEWLPADRPYGMGRIEEFDDEPVDLVEAGALAGDVRAGFARLAAALAVLTDRGAEETELPTDPQRLSFQVAAALELEPALKRDLLALRDTRTRLRRLGALLGPLAADAE
ncbi:MAG: LON peptidase substrate-binding domain-containing protein, partial [Gemmatimonadales bacterium]